MVLTVYSLVHACVATVAASVGKLQQFVGICDTYIAYLSSLAYYTLMTM